MAKLTPTELKAIATRLYEITSKERRRILEKESVKYSKEDFTQLTKLIDDYKKAQQAYNKICDASSKLYDFEKKLARKYITGSKEYYVNSPLSSEYILSDLNKTILGRNIPEIGYNEIFHDLIIGNCSDAKNLIETLQENYIKRLQKALE